MELFSTNPSGWEIAFVVLQIVFTFGLGWFIKLLFNFRNELSNTQKKLHNRMDRIEDNHLSHLKDRINQNYAEFDKQKEICSVYWDNHTEKLETINDRLDEIKDAINEIRDI